MTQQIILLVEDNPADEELTLLAFEQSGILNQVVVVRDGVEALNYLFGTGIYAQRDLSLMPAVIILDLHLPRIGGLEVLQRLRADDRTKFLPVVMVTTSDEERDIMNSYKLGCNSYVRKSVDFTQFLYTAQQLGLYWLRVNLPAPV